MQVGGLDIKDSLAWTELITLGFSFLINRSLYKNAPSLIILFNFKVLTLQRLKYILLEQLYLDAADRGVTVVCEYRENIPPTSSPSCL